MTRNSERGMSLVETLVVLLIASGVMILTYTMIEETTRSSMFNESHNDLAVMSQAAVNTLQSEIVQTRMIFEENALGISYRAALELPASYPAWTTSLLPVADISSTQMTPDTSGTRFAGNSLLLARQLPPLPVIYDHDNDRSTAEIEFLADRYRFEYVYLSPNSNRSFANTGLTLDLMMSVSVEYADYFQLESVTTNRGAIASQLIAAGVQQAWDPGQPIANAFYDLSGATDGTFNAPLPSPTISIGYDERGRRRLKTLLKGLLGGRITGSMAYSVAFVPPSRTPFPLPQAMATFAQPDPSRPGFPAGFEAKIVGPAGNRQVMTRLLLMAHIRGKFEAQQGFVTTAARF
jgi:hypothetical protein